MISIFGITIVLYFIKIFSGSRNFDRIHQEMSLGHVFQIPLLTMFWFHIQSIHVNLWVMRCIDG